MATGFKLADPREYRRGVVLGLTLAEILILLVFLLLLSASAVLFRHERDEGLMADQINRYVSALGPVLDALAARGMSVKDTDELVALIERGNESQSLANELAKARRDRDVAVATAKDVEKDRTALTLRVNELETSNKAMAERVNELDPVAAILRSLPGEPGDRPSEKVAKLIAKASATDVANTNLTGQNAQMRNELARLNGNNGSGLPYCWTTPDGQPIYMLRVTLRDGGVIANDIEPHPRPDDIAWKLLIPMVRGELQPVMAFISQTAQLQAKANAEKCRYAVEVIDGTAATNKPGYKALMWRIGSIFMIHSIRG
jgi:hypothetical protein